MHKIKKIVLTLLISFPLTCWSSRSINTATITASTIQATPSCLKYKVVGVCFWLICHGGCSIHKTLKVDHFLPDLVVTTYPKYGSDPWVEANLILDKASHVIGNKLFSALNHGLEIKPGSSNSDQSSDDDIKLREVDVIGNPALSVFHSKHLLKGQATPFNPYFQSQLDATEWRSGLLEQLYPQSWVPGSGDIGTFLTNDWGSVYPRSGFIMQPNVGKASAVIAVRGANIATTDSFDHISQNLDGGRCPEADCKTSGPVKEKNQKVAWQMLLPNPQIECHTTINYQARPKWIEHQPEKQTYAWVIWREYRACIRGPGKYIGSVGG
ncbi:MAG: TIGR03756 family integrating conjugative element protein [Candidatus Cloacimonetes bacterium]|nr:TIGR03756 family integrating conjugative element protein [Candidatus Cloacimonadota bacterium]